jgi:hypothetical protein
MCPGLQKPKSGAGHVERMEMNRLHRALHVTLNKTDVGMKKEDMVTLLDIIKEG